MFGDRPDASRELAVSAAGPLRFCVAGLEVELRAAGAGGLSALAGHYDEYPSSGRAADLVVAVERVPGFGVGRERGPGYPAFERRLVDERAIAVERFDAEGRIDLPADDGEPVRAAFRVGDSPNSIEAAVRIAASIALPRVGGMIMHASAVAFAGQAFVFAGVSGAGKSTISTMLDDAFASVQKLSDELLILAPAPTAGSGWAVHVTPFIGSAGLPHRAAVDVAAICFLAQAPGHRRVPVDRADAVRELLRHVLAYVAEPDTAARVLSAAARATAAIPCCRLEFAKDPGVAGQLGIA